MNYKLQFIQFVFRKLKLLCFVDNIRLLFRKISLNRKNKLFAKENPNFLLPPIEIAFDAHGNFDWASYKKQGHDLAKRLSDEFCKWNDGQAIDTVMEWGCGPARVIRHLPQYMPESKIIGTDYNPKTIAWCNQYIKNATFYQNELNPPLPFQASTIDAIYAISVFTHLSEDVCKKWINELLRVLKPNGILIVWTNGDYISQFLLSHEKDLYKEGLFVQRDNFEEGKKMFISFHPPSWVKNILLKDFKVLKHYAGGFSSKEQDVWVASPKK